MNKETKKEEEPKRITLDIQVDTHLYCWENEAGLLNAQMSQSSFFINALTWFMSTASKMAEDMVCWSNPEPPENFQRNYQHYSTYLLHLIDGISSQINEYSSDLHNLERQTSGTGKTLDLSNHSTNEGEAINLAKCLEFIKNNPTISSDLSSSIQKEIEGLAQKGGNDGNN